MPLHGKIVVLKRSGGDGTEFPLTATCLFGRKPDCDIRIQLPQVSKEHCRIDLNENKEVILTNLSSVNPTCVNGQALQQSERLKHGDVITVIDRSFRFEYPPPPTPKKRSSVGGKAQVAAVDPHLKDGTNIDNIQRSLDKTQELESKEEPSLLESKTTSPFSDLYQMIKQSLDVKTPRKSSVSVLQTPSSKFCTPKPESARKKDVTPKKVQIPIPIEKAEGDGSLMVTPKSAKRRSVQLSPADTSRRNSTSQKFSLSEAIEHIATQPPKSPRSKEKTSPASARRSASTAKMETSPKTTPKRAEKEKSKKRKSEEMAGDLPTQEMKRKRVSFGGHLSPELFDKRLPPDSPLRRGATPRRSLSLYKPKQSLLRRASVIGLLKECDSEKHLTESKKAKSPAKMKTPSPKKSPKGALPKTPTSAKKSPKAQSPSQRAQSPKSRTSSPGKSPAQRAQSTEATKSPSPATPKKTSPKASPKTVKTTPAKSPTLRKQATPEDKPKRKSTSTNDETPKRKSTSGTVTPVRSPGQTPKVQGRFSVSRITTPSPVAEDAVMELAQSTTTTPKIPLRRKSMKSSAKKTPSLKSATKVIQRKSGMMRSSMKVMTSWADIVRFGKAKVQAGVPTRAQVIKKSVKKKAGPKPQTPKRRHVNHISTGHAASPATIVVGRAHRLRVAHPAGAPPKIVTNTAVLRKNLKMDEDLTGLSEMFKTPKNEKRRSAKIMSKTPQADLSKSFIEPSVLNTPEETGEMVVSPMSVASTIKGQKYNSEAVQRLLGEESFIAEISASDMQQETLQQNAQEKKSSPKTPKQNPPLQDGLTGVKRIMKTPKQKAEPIEDLRGKLLKTPKQKSEQQECLSAVKRVMRTPKAKTAPIDDIRGKLLKTPKQKIQQQEECLTGVKRIMTTPKERAQHFEDLQGKILKTPKQKVAQEECLSAVKALIMTPDQKVEQQESITTPKLETEQPEFLTGVKRVMKTPKQKYEPIDDIRGKLLQTPKQKIEQQECLTGVRRIMSTPKQKYEPVEDMVGLKRVMATPKEKVPPVEKNFGIKRLVRSPRLRGNAPVEDFEGLEELMKEPVEEQICGGTEGIVIKESETIVQQVADKLDSESEKIIVTEEIIHQLDSTLSSCAEGTMPSVGESAQEESVPEAKPLRGRRAKTTEPPVENKQDEIQAPVRARRGRKVDTSAPVHSTSAKTAEEPDQKESAPVTVKPRRGRLPKKVSSESCDVITCETAQMDEETNVMPPEILDVLTERPKTSRGRKAKVVDTEIPAATEENKDDCEEVVTSVRARRGKKPEAPATLAVRQRKGKAVKAQENAGDTEVISELGDNQTCVLESTEEMEQENKRGRKINRVNVVLPEPEITAVEREPQVVEAQPVEDVECAQPVLKAKPQRGRRAKVQVEQPQPENEITEECCSSVCEAAEDVQVQQLEPTQKGRKGRRTKPTVEPPEAKITPVEREPVEDKQPEQDAPAEKPQRGKRSRTAEVSQAATQGKRSRAAKLEQECSNSVPEKQVDDVLKSSEPSKRICRTKKDDPKPENLTAALEETPVNVEPLKTDKLVCEIPKSRRGTLKMKEAVTEEVTASSLTDKPKKGRKKQTPEIIVEVEEAEQIPEEDLAKVRPTRGRGKTTVQLDASEAIPAKRARKVTTVSTEESTALGTHVVAMPVPAESVKRGRRAAKTPVSNTEAETKESNDGIEEVQLSQRSVKWKADVQVFEVTPLKTARGRKTKTDELKEAKSKNNPEKASDLEVKAQPTKRTRRGPKAADVAEESTKTVVDETQPKTRRGRSAKK